MTTDTVVAETDVDDRAETGDEPRRRRIRTTPLGRGERIRKVDVEIGDYLYAARCPKLVVWQEMASIIEEQALSRGERRRRGDREPAAGGRVTTDRIRLTSAVTLFLRGCLTAADWNDLQRDLGNPDDELDVPDLWAAGLSLVVEFRPDMEEMAKRIGMKIPESIGTLASQIGDDGLLVDPPSDPAPPAPAPGRKPAARKGKARPGK